MRQTYTDQINEIRRKRRRAVLSHWNAVKQDMSKRAYSVTMGVWEKSIRQIGEPDWDPDEATWAKLEAGLPPGWGLTPRAPIFVDLPLHAASRDATGRIGRAQNFWETYGGSFDEHFIDKVELAGLADYATIVARDERDRLVLRHFGAALPLYGRNDPARAPGRLVGGEHNTSLMQAFEMRYRRVITLQMPLLQHCEVAVGSKWYVYLSLVTPLGDSKGIKGAMAVASICEERDLSANLDSDIPNEGADKHRPDRST